MAGNLTVGVISSDGHINFPVHTTANRPTNAVQGTVIYNSTIKALEVYSGTNWTPFGRASVSAIGGIISESGGYKIHTFPNPGNFTFNVQSGSSNIDYLIVGGGGGGGQHHGGGGGACQQDGAYRLGAAGQGRNLSCAADHGDILKGSLRTCEP